jgi:fermentation-respiration switch protein FrsA (DUF1100 family)
MAIQAHMRGWTHRQQRDAGRAGRALIAGTAGLAGLLLAFTTAGPALAMNGPTPTAVTGTAVGVVGFALLVVAYQTATAGYRHRVHVFGALVVILLLQFMVVPAFNVGVITHAPRPAIRAATTLRYPGARDVTFSTPDGVRLAAWYVPGRNQASVILMHGSHGTRITELPYLRFLADAGYAVLAVDARGHGESGGETNALGWYGDRDVAGAYRFLTHQAGIDPRRIAGLGLSLGAEELLRAAGRGVPLAAIIADGAGASTSTDSALTAHGADAPVYHAVTWLTYRGVELLSGEHEPQGLTDVLHATSTPVLLIASSARNELLLNQHFQQLLGRSAQLWWLPNTGHTEGYGDHPARYRTRILDFLRPLSR